MAEGSERSVSGRAIGIGATALVIGVAAIILVVLLARPADPEANGAAGPSASSSADLSPSATAPVSPPVEPSPSVAPTLSATIQPTAGWQEGAMFGSDGFIDWALSVTRGAGGFIAVGTHFEDVGPLVMGPGAGRVWFSSDGRSWADVTPPDTFTDAVLTHVFAAADGALIAHGYVPRESGPVMSMAWESFDGQGWSVTSTPFPDGSVRDIVRGGKGYLALASDVWLSSDGRTWEMVLEGNSMDGIRSIGAGDDGFVALGIRGQGDASETFAIASADGREWIEATVPPTGAYVVVPRGGDWTATGTSTGACGAEPGDDRVWSSANGLEWAEIGSIPWRPIQLETDPECWAVQVDLHAAGSWLIASPRAGYACCDNPLIEATQHISRDGRSWVALPFPAANVAEGVHGSSIAGAILEGDMLILVGQSNNRAAFWFNEGP